MIRLFFGVPENYENSPGEVLGLNGPYGKGEKGLKGWPHAPHGMVRIGLGGGGAPSFLLLLLGLGKGGVDSYLEKDSPLGRAL